MDLPACLRIPARANRLANHRVHQALCSLSREDFHAPRTSFFPSLAQTLNHILADEFMLPSESHLRAADMAAIGWQEATIYGTLPS